MAPQVLGALVRRYGHFDLAEDAVQEALLAAARQWPDDGQPDEPRAWLVRVASRRLVDRLRSEQARRDREVADAVRVPTDVVQASGADHAAAADADDSLLLLFLCCHPVLTQASQVALTLRAVGGLTTAEIARAFLVPEATMGQRISRAKQTVRRSGATFTMPPPGELSVRLDAVMQVLYLIFDEGYVATSGDELQRVVLASEAIRLARMTHRLLPDEPEVAGLLALLLLTDARRDARGGPGGVLVPMAEQDRGRWDRERIEQGSAILTAAMQRGMPGPYQLQAAIAAVHDEAATSEETDWRQILGLYRLLERHLDSPMVTLGRAVALAMVGGPEAGLALLATLDGDERLARSHRPDAVRAHLEEMAGHHGAALERYRTAARRTTSVPEQRYLLARAARLDRMNA